LVTIRKVIVDFFTNNFAKSPLNFFSFNCRRWWSKETVAVVTGANKGIGFATVKKLAELGLTVVLTARDPEKGEKAAETLRAEGNEVWFHLLDVSDPLSIQGFASWLHQVFGGLDILVSLLLNSFSSLNMLFFRYHTVMVSL
jgi:carbonyl reductase 1